MEIKSKMTWFLFVNCNKPKTNKLKNIVTESKIKTNKWEKMLNNCPSISLLFSVKFNKVINAKKKKYCHRTIYCFLCLCYVTCTHYGITFF